MDKILISIYLIFILIICILINKLFLPFLTKLKFGQSIRKEGPIKHYQKQGTPTMGGISILFSFTLVLMGLLIVLSRKNTFVVWQQLLLLLIPLYGYAIIGFVDDYLIVVKKNNQGLKPLYKLGLQLIASIAFYWLYLHLGYSTSINFFGVSWDLKFLYGPLILLIFISTTNATNITDGIDGLLSITSLFSILGLGIMAYIDQNITVFIVAISMIIAIVAFLFFNFPKAAIFMGDTGSLMIGAIMASMAIILKYEILLIIIGFVYVIETLSVVLQVWFFKRTKGQRLLKMSPFHHHLELSGFSEVEIDLILGAISLLFAILGIYMGVVLF